jgi:hypothetical protein
VAYRAPWIDEEGRRLDEAEIAAFSATLRARRRWGVVRVLGLAIAIGAIVLGASRTAHKREVVFLRKAECLYDGCYCRNADGDLEQIGCNPPSIRECLPIADHCEP